MGKYYSYGQHLDEAFKSAREKYLKAYGELMEAEKEAKAANGWMQERYVGERETRKAKAAARLVEAKAKFAETERRAWPDFADRLGALSKQLEKEVKESNMVSPDGIDNNGLELLKSGLMSPDEMTSFIEKYDGNATMLKLVGKYASEAADNARESTDRAKYLAVAYATREGFGKVLRQWDGICQIAKICAGMARDRKSSPDHIAFMSSKWEEMSAAAIAEM